jgi:hypothetical protein
MRAGLFFIYTPETQIFCKEKSGMRNTQKDIVTSTSRAAAIDGQAIYPASGGILP